ncbi:heparan-alpha-glucosaminide N-acetyltransferase domain-containing protein [Cyclobacterium plantarum]|uniref:DUF5009 domain-containing protein n=1 Tax=Cyclobacterium plantarum TaxID=2716263 RepID=A0ABX0H269_9BACT|nr:DUF5009 domain-containing protein [Cyclobacterium plantarum]NHE55890.1 DUF5009 domain-containing protein [Cyclobacterium plantarum]
MVQASTQKSRNHAIDVFRALTMMLMIFVNDLWTLNGVPEWLKHVPAGVDGMGLSDVVFPAFLFIVGLSIPLAIENRWKKGATNKEVLLHVLYRSAALLIMGLFHVNLENYQEGASLLAKPVWQIFLTLAFFLIWLDYSKSVKSSVKTAGKSLGWLILVFLAIVYKGGDLADPKWMDIYWWGILGLIGWAYLIASLVYMASKGKLSLVWLAFLSCLLFSSLSKLNLLEFLSGLKPYFWLIDDGATPAFAISGMLVSLYYRSYYNGGKQGFFWVVLASLSITGILLGIVTRPLWGIHKIGSSPSWVLICIGISMASYGFLIWLVDIKKRKDWFTWIKPAGTSTLTCYLLPYIHYGLLSLSGWALPLFVRTGLPGLLKSLVYALVIILITGLLEKKNLRLKI